MLHVNTLSYALEEKTILDSISFSTTSKEIVGLVGPNGSGKTTLLRCLFGLLEYSGNITIDGRALKDIPRKTLARTVSYIPQSVDSIPAYSVEQFVAMGRYPHRTLFSAETKESKDAIESALILTDTSSLRTRTLPTLSGGERQRVMLAAALAQEPKYILLDEPTAFLDPAHELQTYEMLKSICHERDTSILVSSHSLNSLCAACDRILALNEGALAFDGPPNTFLDPSRLQSLYSTRFKIFVSEDGNTTYAIAESRA